MTIHKRWQASLAIALVVLVLLAALPRLRIILSSPGVVDADETTFLLMARHIAQFRDAPVFYYGQAYMGSLAAYLAALCMGVAGFTATAARMAPVVLSMIFALLSYRVGCITLGRRGGFVAGAYAALAPPLLVIFGAKLFGYMEIVVLGNLLFLHLLLQPEIPSKDGRGRFKWWAVLGFLIGLGVWCHILFGVYVVTAVIFALSYYRYHIPALRPEFLALPVAGCSTGFVVGALPLLIFNATHSGATFSFTSQVANPLAISPTQLVSSLYNLFVADLPSVLGTLLPWRVFRAEMSLVLLPEPVLWIGFTILVVTLVLGIFAFAIKRGCALWISQNRAHHNHARPAFGWRAIFILALLLAAFCLATPWLFFSNSGTILEAGLDPRIPYGSLALVGREITSPAVIGMLLWLPGVIALFAIREKRSTANMNPNIDGNVGDNNVLENVVNGAAINRRAIRLLVIHVLVCLSACLFSTYGLARSPRFLLPLYSSLPTLFALAVCSLNRRFKYAGTSWGVGILAINLAIQLAAAPEFAVQPGHYAGRVAVPRSFNELAERLEAQGYTHIYSPYFAGFPLVWASDERIKVSNGTEWRIPELDQAVASSSCVAFVFYRGRLDERFFREFLSRNKIPVSVEDAGSFRIFTGSDLAGIRNSPLWSEVQVILLHP